MGRGGDGEGQRFVSRLEAVKEAVGRHLEHMAITEPQNKVRREMAIGWHFEQTISLPPSLPPTLLPSLPPSLLVGCSGSI